MKTFVTLLIFIPVLAFAESVVINGLPNSKVISNAESTERQSLINEHSKRNEFRVLVTKRNDKYIWTTRENKELIRTTSGAMQIFIEPGGAGYVEVLDSHFLPESVRPSGKRYWYKEHLRNMLGNITYWGKLDEYHP